MKQMMKNSIYIIFWGSLWGIFEAVLGYGLHLIPVPGLAGAVMFPVAFSLLLACYKTTGDKNALVKMALFAAAIKFSNFFMPGVMPAKVINPAVAMILEALVVWGVFAITERGKNVLVWMSLTAFMWRALFLGYQAAHYFAVNGWETYFDNGTSSLLVFFFGLGAVNALLIFGIMYLDEHKKLSFKKEFFSRVQTSGMTAAVMLVVAVLLEAVL